METQKHSKRCEEAKSRKCRCSCHGEMHNPVNRISVPSKTDDLFGGFLDRKVEVWKERRTALDDEPTFTLFPTPPLSIRAWRVFSNGQISSARTNVPHRYVWHSPGGFEWGYEGSGPADFALNALALFVDPGTARLLHQDFKRAFIAPLPPEGGVIEGSAIVSWILSKKDELRAVASGG